MNTFASLFKFIFNVGSWIFLIVIALMIVFTIGSNTNLLGGYKSYLIYSGSMEPTILIGDIIIVHPQTEYLKNDVVTFYAADGRVVTHRVAQTVQENNETTYITKGDANRSEDDDQIKPEAIIGKVIFVVPKLGHFVAFSRSLPGLVLLVLIPAGALIIDQLFKLKNA